MMKTLFNVGRVVVCVVVVLIGILDVSNGMHVVLSMLYHWLVVDGATGNEKVTAHGTTLLAFFKPHHDAVFMKGVLADTTGRENDTVALLVV